MKDGFFELGFLVNWRKFGIGLSGTAHNDLELRIPFGNCIDKPRLVFYSTWNVDSENINTVLVHTLVYQIEVQD